MKFKNFSDCAKAYLSDLENQERFSTSHVYENALNSFIRFNKNEEISWDMINKDNLKKYELYLKDRDCKPNTISSYLRMIRCIYNRGLESESVGYIPKLFSNVYTGIQSLKKKAIDEKDLKKLLCAKPKTKKSIQTQKYTALMFLLCGMPFVDLAHLKKNSIQNDILSYNRHKTGAAIKLEIIEDAKKYMSELCGKDSKYLFSILDSRKKGKEAYSEYIKKLAWFNNNLKHLSKELDLKEKITSYSIRHSFATSLKKSKVPVEMISEMLGHSSIKTTQIYLKSFSVKELNQINLTNYQSITNGKYE